MSTVSYGTDKYVPKDDPGMSATEAAVTGLRKAVDAARAGLVAVDKQLVKIDGAGEVTEEGPKPLVNVLDEKAQEQRRKQDEAKKKRRCNQGCSWLAEEVYGLSSNTIRRRAFAN